MNYGNIFQQRHYNYLAYELPFVLMLNEFEVQKMALSLKNNNENFNYERFMTAWRDESERRLLNAQAKKIAFGANSNW